MEKVHQTECRHWIFPSKVKVRDFIKQMKNMDIRTELFINPAQLSVISCQVLQVSRELINDLEDECHESTLNCVGEDEDLYAFYDKSIEIPQNTDLETLREQRIHLEKYKNKEERAYRTAVLHSLRYRSRPIKIDNPFKAPIDNSNFSYPEVVLTLQFYRPIKEKTHFGNTHRYSFVADQELQVLGSQKLTDLRDAFICVSDIASHGECSQNPKAKINKKRDKSEISKSGFFFINDTFYNDLRDPLGKDYSQ